MSDFVPLPPFGHDQTPTSPRPAVPAAPVAAAPPSAPPARGRGLLLVMVIVALLALMFTGIGIAVRGMTPPATTTALTASAILQRAEAARLDDTAFSINETQTAQLGDATSGGITVTETSTGQGMFTHVPSRLHVIINPIGGSALGASTTEYIYDGTTLYVRIPAILRGNSKKTWLKIADSTSNPLSILFATSIDPASISNYSLLEDPALIGSTTINGHKAWHLHASLATTGVLATLPGSSSTSSEDLWLAQDTLLPLQIVLDEHDSLSLNIGTPTARSTTETTDTTSTLHFTTWNTGIRIALPPASQVTTQLPTPTFPPQPTPTP